MSRFNKDRLDQDVYRVMLLYRGLQRQNDRALKPYWREQGLSERALYILWLVSAGLDRPAKLVEYFDVLPSTITFDTDKLVAAGLITRQALPSDRRVVQLRLTEEGNVVYRGIGDTLNALLRPRLEALEPGELETFLAIGQKLVQPTRSTGSADATAEAPSVARPQEAARRKVAAAPAPAPAPAKGRRARLKP